MVLIPETGIGASLVKTPFLLFLSSFLSFFFLSTSTVGQKLYKALSEVKGEVETVIKTGRHVVQRQQTEQPQEMDQRVTALKLLYNQLGAQVSGRPGPPRTNVSHPGGRCRGGGAGSRHLFPSLHLR